jgi:hypothetical protein
MLKVRKIGTVPELVRGIAITVYFASAIIVHSDREDISFSSSHPAHWLLMDDGTIEQINFQPNLPDQLLIELPVSFKGDLKINCVAQTHLEIDYWHGEMGELHFTGPSHFSAKRLTFRKVDIFAAGNSKVHIERLRVDQCSLLASSYYTELLVRDLKSKQLDIIAIGGAKTHILSGSALSGFACGTNGEINLQGDFTALRRPDLVTH